MADHPGQLDDVAQLHLPPLAASVGLAQRGDQRAGLGAQLLPRLGQRAQLSFQATARFAALLVKREQLGVDAGQLLLERTDECLESLPALVEIALGLRLGRL